MKHLDEKHDLPAPTLNFARELGRVASTFIESLKVLTICGYTENELAHFLSDVENLIHGSLPQNVNQTASNI